MKTVFLPKAVWHQVFERLPPESRVVGGEYPRPNFWLRDDQGDVLVFLVEKPLAEE